MKKKAYISKGNYSHFQIGGYFSVQQYIITERKGKRCLLLRFKNEMKRQVDSVFFVVKQFNASGKLLGNIRIRYSDICVRAGQLYCHDKGIVLNKECTDFEIHIKYIISGKTKYSFKNGLVTDHYDIRGYNKTDFGSRSESKLTIKQKYNRKNNCFIGIATVSFMFLIIALVGLIMQL